MNRERIDVVYTWVDGAWPGYPELLATHARRPVDLNPNRYRDNLDLLRFSLRSLAQYAPWVDQVVLVTQRPQVPQWLDTNRVRVVHHDEFIDASALPTFSSFAIVANLCKIPGLSARFVYVEDDYLALREVSLDDVLGRDGKVPLHASSWLTDAMGDATNPWNVAIAQANACLDGHFGRRRRRSLEHAPVLFDRTLWPEFQAAFADVLHHTTQSRFRNDGTVPAEYLFSYWMWHRGAATLSSRWRTHRDVGYLGLHNVPTVLAAQLRWLARRQPLWACLNDNFGTQPNPRAVAVTRRFLEGRLPTPSPYERR